MKLRGFLVSAALVIMLASLAAAPVRAEAETMTMTFHDEVMSFRAEPLPCPGPDEPGTITITFNGVIHVSVSAAGTSNFQFTGTGTFVFTPDDPAGVSAKGRVTQWFGANVNLASAQLTVTFHVTATASDGTILHFQGTIHVTAVGDDVIIEFMKAVCA